MTQAILPGERPVSPPTLCLRAGSQRKKDAMRAVQFATTRGEAGKEQHRGEDQSD
jgi:hypothetical protein